MRADHFVKDYNALVAGLKSRMDETAAMSAAVGGEFAAFGQIEADLLRMVGLKDGMSLIDIGCGSGRAAVALARDLDIDYFGTDVVPDLIAHARTITPAHYRYAVVERIEIPAEDASADMACAFSLFTHLLHDETFIYLEEVKRVLRPGGILVFSFLEFRNPQLWPIFQATALQTKAGTRQHLNVFIERGAIEAWALNLGMTVVDWMSGADGEEVRLSRPVTFASGQTVTESVGFGQSVCVLRK